MRKALLFSLLIASSSVIAQDDNFSKIRQELIQWDPVRGEWLADSYQAMSANQPIPDRTFPEDYTPAEMFSMVPEDRQGRIREYAQNLGSTPSQTNPRIPSSQQGEQPRVPSSQQEQGRRPVGEPTSTTPTTGNRVPSSESANIFRRPNCDLTMGRSYGDPHIRTFDGKSYSFQTVGEYVLSSSPDRSFEVQARQKPETDKVSLNTAVAMNVFGDRVGVYASDFPDQNNATPVRVNGLPIYISNETYFLPRGGTIQNNGSSYIITWPTGEKVEAKISNSGRMRFMNISVHVNKCSGNYWGLMGNANGRSDDDFAGTNGRSGFENSSIFDPFESRTFGRSTSAMERAHLSFLARDFGSQFLVNEQTTLFDYSFGVSSWSFYDPTFPREHLTMGDISAADRQRALRECQRQGILMDDMNGCVMDFAHANIPPTPRPTVQPRRPQGELSPVAERRPNVNRPDIHQNERRPSTGPRTPSGEGTNPGPRTPSGQRTPSNTQDVEGTRTPSQVEDDRQQNGSRVPQTQSTTNDSERVREGSSRVPVRELPATEENREMRTPSTVSDEKPTSTTFERKPIGEASRVSNPSSRPANQGQEVTPSRTTTTPSGGNNRSATPSSSPSEGRTPSTETRPSGTTATPSRGTSASPGTSGARTNSGSSRSSGSTSGGSSSGGSRR